MKQFKNFQIRWAEPVGRPECPYLVRWVLILFGYSVRLHHWIRSDEKRHFHDHAWNFLTIILKGRYYDVAPYIAGVPFNLKGAEPTEIVKAGSIRYRKAEHKHYVRVPKEGCWSLLFCGRPKRKWGFWVNNHLWRPLRYFSKFGLPPCDLQ